MSAIVNGSVKVSLLPTLEASRRACLFTLLPASAHRLYTDGMHVGYLFDLYPRVAFGSVMSRGQGVLDQFYERVHGLDAEARAVVFPTLMRHLGMKKRLDAYPTFLEGSTEMYHRVGFELGELRLAQSLLHAVANFVSDEDFWYTPLEGAQVAAAWTYVCQVAQRPYLEA